MFFLRVRPTSIAGKKAGKIGLIPAILIALGFFGSLSALYLVGVRATAVDPEAEARATLHKQITYQFELASSRFSKLLPVDDAPSGFPTTLKGKTAVVMPMGMLHDLHWDLPMDLCAEQPDQVKNVIVVSTKKEPGIAASLYLFNLETRKCLGKLTVKSTPDMSDPQSGYRFVNGAVSDAFWAWRDKLK